MGTALESLRLAFAFLTCIPVGASGAAPVRPARALMWFPLVGLLLGQLQVTLAALLHERLGNNLSAVLLVATLAALTGGLHLDGVADVFDAWSGGRGDKTRALAIMRDSRIGAHGAAALCLLLLAKVFALSDLLERNATTALLMYPMIARWGVVPLVVFFPSARKDGLGASFHAEARTSDFVFATMIAGLSLATATYFAHGVLAAAAGSLAVMLAFAALLQRRFGGLTGDAYGAALELGELAFIVFAVR